MRMTQVIGLNGRAETFLARGKVAYEEAVVRRYENGKVQEFQHSGEETPRLECGEFEGMFGEPFPLYAYEVEGKLYQEYVQTSPWSSGPCIFLALKDEGGDPLPESVWSEDEINASL